MIKHGFLLAALLALSLPVLADSGAYSANTAPKVGLPQFGVTTNTAPACLDNAGTTVSCPPLSGTTGSIGGGALLAGACTSGTVAITGTTTNMAVLASPVTYPGDGNYWMGYVSSAGTVTVKVCAAVAGTPSASVYNVRVI